MKRYFLVVSIFFLLSFCKKEEPKMCGCNDPTTEIKWVKDLIEKAEKDTSGRYKGAIYFEIINDEHIFFVMMQLDSTNGNLKHWFKCNGEELQFSSIGEEPRDMKLNNIIYKNY